jgi:hypothetical protein
LFRQFRLPRNYFFVGNSQPYNQDHIFLSLETIFWFFGVKILKFFDADPGWRQFGSGIRDGTKSDPGSGMGKSRIRDKHPGSATLNSLTKDPDPAPDAALFVSDLQDANKN